MPVGPKILCPEKTYQSQSISPHVDAHVRHRLRAVDQTRDAVSLGLLDHRLDRRDRAERIRHLRDRDELGPRAEQFLIFLEQDLAAVVDRSDAELRAFLGGELLPGHDVGVVLETADDDFVIGADVLPTPALRDQIDRLGRAADEHDFVGGRRVQKAAHLLARPLVGVGRAGGEFVRGAVDVGVFVLVEIFQRRDDRRRLLRGRRVVEPDQSPAVDALVKDRKVAFGE